MWWIRSSFCQRPSFLITPWEHKSLTFVFSLEALKLIKPLSWGLRDNRSLRRRKIDLSNKSQRHPRAELLLFETKRSIKSLPLSLSLSPSLSYSYIHSHTLTHTVEQAHAHTHTHTVVQALTHAQSLERQEKASNKWCLSVKSIFVGVNNKVEVSKKN